MNTTTNRCPEYQKGYNILIEQGLTHDDITGLDDDLVIGTYLENEYHEGRIAKPRVDYKVLDSGEVQALTPVYEAFVHGR